MRFVLSYVATKHRIGERIERPPFPPEAMGPPGTPQLPPSPDWIQHEQMVWIGEAVLILWSVRYWVKE